MKYGKNDRRYNFYCETLDDKNKQKADKNTRFGWSSLSLYSCYKYTVDGKEYVKRKFVGTYSTCPKEGNSVTVNYQDDVPSKCKLDL